MAEAPGIEPDSAVTLKWVGYNHAVRYLTYCLALLTACASDDAGGSAADSATAASTTGATTMATTMEDSTTDVSDSETTTTDSMETDTSGDSQGDGPLLDVGSPGTASAEGGDDDGCAKVDFLFVVDSSGSMADKQAALAEAFPSFIESIQETLEGQDHHIMVVDSDESSAYVCEDLVVGGVNGTHCDGVVVQPNCEGYVCGITDTLGPCASTLGAGVNFAHGGNTSNMDCGFPDGRRYLTDQDPGLEAAFSCAATVGTSGETPELPMTAMVDALAGDQSAGGVCNEGFLRDDAILVVTIVTDDPPGTGDSGELASALAWYEAVLEAKNGNPEAVVAIGIIPTGDVSCVSGQNTTPAFENFIDMWGEQGVKASVCTSDYGSIFDSALGIIDSACDGFVPPG